MTTLLILSGFYIIWLAALLTVAYTPRLFHNYTLFKAINSILFVVISVLVWRHSGMNMFTYWPLLAAFCLAAFGDIAIGVANNRHGAAGASHSISGMAGVGFFSIAHIFYLLFFTQFCPMEWYHFILPIIAMLAMLRMMSPICARVACTSAGRVEGVPGSICISSLFSMVMPPR